MEIYRGNESKAEIRSRITSYKNCVNGKPLWAKYLIVDIRKWTEKDFWDGDYNLIQMLGATKCFPDYLNKLKLGGSKQCRYCRENNTIEHTMYWCQRWSEDKIKKKIYKTINPRNIVNRMLEMKDNLQPLPKVLQLRFLAPVIW